ncbi:MULTISPECIES: hypothetical protein [Xanthomonas]|uniref:hypothetical protein n=1 Tax=Xanthomonas TaxID=338 RepID=UPI00225B381D|nr:MULTISPECIES: hypothetical protein [Xanthomonas]MDY4283092.1 hypothetical protein [Xanthomonas sp. LF06-19]
MVGVTIHNKEELKAALSGSADEIVVQDQNLIKHLRAIRRLRKAGPLAIGAVVAAIPLIPFTGGASLPVTLFGFLGMSAIPVTAGIAGLAVAISGVVLIGLLTDWEEVEMAGVFKLKRKSKGA